MDGQKLFGLQFYQGSFNYLFSLLVALVDLLGPFPGFVGPLSAPIPAIPGNSGLCRKLLPTLLTKAFYADITAHWKCCLVFQYVSGRFPVFQYVS